MATLSYPGVYMQEISSGVRPVEAASTSTAAFVGLAEMGADEARRITNWTEFQRYYGTFINDSKLAHSVFQYFNNGGRQCYIVRVTRSDAVAADVTIQNRAPTPIAGLKFAAKNKGAWGNYLFLQIEDGSLDPGNEFKISVRRQVEVDVIPENFLDISPLEVHDNLSMDENAANYVVDVLSQNSTFIDALVLTGNKSLQRGIHRGGLGVTINPGGLENNLNFEINLDYDGFQLVTLPPAIASETNLVTVATAIETAVRAKTKKKTSTPDAAFSAFTCTVETVDATQRLILQSGTGTSTISSVRIQDAASNSATVPLKLGAGIDGGRSEDALAVRRPAKADAIQIGDAVEGVSPVADVTPGSDGTVTIVPQDFVNAFEKLNNKTDFSILAVPGESFTSLVDAGMNYCQKRPLQDVFYIGDTNEDDNTPDKAGKFRANLKKPNSYGAIYFPWIKALDPSGKSSEPILLPPSGYIAGLYARTDANRGVWKAPAGTEASLGGAVGLAVELTDVEHGNLNPLNVNVIRRFATSGIVSFGARTVTSDPEWKYVPVRRTAIMLRVSIYNGIQWAVFEPMMKGYGRSCG